MIENLKIGENAKVLIDWHVHPSNYSREKEANIVAKFAAKYSIPKENVKVNPKFFRPAEVDLLIGDPTKAETVLGWKREIDFAELVKRMVKNDLEIVKAENGL